MTQAVSANAGIPPAAPDSEPPTESDKAVAETAAAYPNWAALRWLLLFRLALVLGLSIAFSPSEVGLVTLRQEWQPAWTILPGYAVLVLLSGFGLSLRWPRPESQVHSAIFVDILTLTLLMHAAGGITSGLGILIAVAVAVGALMMEGRLSLLFASFAAIAVLGQQIYASMEGGGQATSFTQAGLLGLLFFAVALLSHVLYRRVRLAEELAARRKVDIDDLSKLNDFIIRSISTGILVADGDRRLRLINDAAIELLGTRPSRRGAALAELSPALSAWLAREIHLGPEQTDLVRIGEREVRASMKLLGDHRANGVILYLRDNRAVVMEAQQIKMAALGTLTASIAHNIRNPLSAISHAGQLLAEDAVLSADNRHLTEIIRRNSARIEETVHSVLQLSRRQQMEPAHIELGPWLAGLLEDFREAHDLRPEQCQLILESPATTSSTDPRHLQQIVSNLCENAMIHGAQPNEPLQIQARIGTLQPQGSAYLEIADAGPGVPAERIGEIFDPFFTTSSQGTGLGLYIARELADANGIRLDYRALEPHGACFRLTFPSRDPSTAHRTG